MLKRVVSTFFMPVMLHDVVADEVASCISEEACGLMVSASYFQETGKKSIIRRNYARIRTSNIFWKT